MVNSRKALIGADEMERKRIVLWEYQVLATALVGLGGRAEFEKIMEVLPGWDRRSLNRRLLSMSGNKVKFWVPGPEEWILTQAGRDFSKLKLDPSCTLAVVNLTLDVLSSSSQNPAE